MRTKILLSPKVYVFFSENNHKGILKSCTNYFDYLFDYQAALVKGEAVNLNIKSENM